MEFWLVIKILSTLTVISGMAMFSIDATMKRPLAKHAATIIGIGSIGICAIAIHEGFNGIAILFAFIAIGSFFVRKQI